MSEQERIIGQGNELLDSIQASVTTSWTLNDPPSRVILSFDLYALLVEYFLLSEEHSGGPSAGCMLENILRNDRLCVRVGLQDIPVKVDFFAPAETIRLM